MASLTTSTTLDMSATKSPAAYLADYALRITNGSLTEARRALFEALSPAPANDWLECGRGLVLRNDFDSARAVFAAGIARFPDADDIRLALAGICWQTGQTEQAETQLHELLARQPTHVAATFLLVRILGEHGRLQAAGRVMRQLFDQAKQDIEAVIQAVEMLDDIQQTQDAATICEAEIASGCTDPRIHAYAGMLGIQLGQFERVREHYAFALAHNPQAVEWNIPIGLSSLQRYVNNSHPDFQLFRDVLQQPGLSEKARRLTLFALGKACDDTADYAQATRYLREANAMAHARSSWSRKHWRRAIEARLAAKPCPFQLTASDKWAPLFIVGVPRSGTTLLAELLARHPDVRNRGELGWLTTIARELEQASTAQPGAFQQAAARYEAQLLQDDEPAHWYIDKQPLNLLHVDLILALWPNARIIHCQRNARDTALSLWSQSFHDSAHDYAYDFDDIAAVIQGCDRLMAHWHARYAASIRTVRYEELTADPDSCLRELSHWLGLSAQETPGTTNLGQVITTASAWQARQPVYTRSVARWRSYAPFIPELLRLPDK